MQWLLEFYNSGTFGMWVAAITATVTAATAITAITPTTADDKIVNGILKFLNFFAGNVFMNKNADEVKKLNQKGYARFSILFLITLSIGLGACSYSLNYKHQMANGEYVHGTDVNTTHLISVGSHSNREWLCKGEKFQSAECKKAHVSHSDNPSILGTLAGPAADYAGAREIGKGLGDSGTNISNNSNSSALSGSKSISKSSSKSHSKSKVEFEDD